ncbi:MAG: AAA family ATPase [Candidatus Micrarchaeia archaeon]
MFAKSDEERALIATGLSFGEAAKYIGRTDELDAKYRRRFDIFMRYIRGISSGEVNEPLIIIVGGIPGTGKTTLASELAIRLGIRIVLGGDTLREFLRGMVDEKAYPVLFSSVYEAWKHFGPEPTREAVIKGYVEQSRIMNACLARMLERCERDGESIVLEYLHFLPSMLEHQLRFKGAVGMALELKSREEHIQRFRMRQRYSHYKSPVERLINNLDKYEAMSAYMIEDARRHGIPVLESGDIQRAIDQALDIVYAKMEKLVK